jgi:hypothetical protein
MDNKNQIFLTYRDEEKLPYVKAYMKKYISFLNELDIQYHKRGNEFTPSYFVVERYKGNMGYRSVIDVKLFGKITSECIFELNHYANILSTGNELITERIFIVSRNCSTMFVPLNFKIICLDNIIKYEDTVA